MWRLRVPSRRAAPTRTAAGTPCDSRSLTSQALRDVHEPETTQLLHNPIISLMEDDAQNAEELD